MPVKFELNRCMQFPMMAALALVCGASPVSLSAGTPLNLLIVTADDLNHDSWFGSKVGATPNLDAFAATCVRFEHCHLAAPICQPSREALMTGRVPHRSGGSRYLSPDGPDDGMGHGCGRCNPPGCRG